MALTLSLLCCFRKEFGSVAQGHRDGGYRVPSHITEASQPDKFVGDPVPIGRLRHVRGGTDLLQPRRGKSGGPFVAEVDRERLLRCMAQLSDLQREAIALTFYGGRTHVQAAEILGAPLGTVKARIRDALIKLRDSMLADAAGQARDDSGDG